MGTHFFKTTQPGSIRPSNLNMAARAFNAPSYSGRQAGTRASKDIAADAGLNKGILKPITKSAASNAPGPKKV